MENGSSFSDMNFLQDFNFSDNTLTATTGIWEDTSAASQLPITQGNWNAYEELPVASADLNETFINTNCTESVINPALITTRSASRAENAVQSNQSEDSDKSHMRISAQGENLGEGQREVYCLCRKPDDHRIMIQCDKCREWYHLACVKLTKAKADKIRKYYCPVCNPLNQVAIPTEEEIDAVMTDEHFESVVIGGDNIVNMDVDGPKKNCLYPGCQGEAREKDAYCSDNCAVMDADNVLKRLAVQMEPQPEFTPLNAPTKPLPLALSVESVESDEYAQSTQSTPSIQSTPPVQSVVQEIKSTTVPELKLNTMSKQSTPSPNTENNAVPVKDRIRKLSIKQFTDIFTPLFADLTKNNDMSGSDGEHLAKAEKLARNIEFAMFNNFATKNSNGIPVTCDQPYKSKFRSLYTNLKDKKNSSLRLKVVKGDIFPEKLVNMSSEDLANPELKSMTEKIRRESINKSVLQAPVHEPRIKKTHKGEFIIVGARSSSPGPDNFKDDQKPNDDTSLISPTSPSTSFRTRLPQRSDSSSSFIGADSKDNTVAPRATSSSLDQMLRRLSASDSPSADKRSPDEAAWDPSAPEPTLEESSPFMGSPMTGLSPSTTDSIGNTPPFTASPSPPHSPSTGKVLSNKPVWSGQVIYNSVADFKAEATLVAARTIQNRDWSQIMTPTMFIEGRIKIDDASRYLSQQGCSVTKDVVVIQISPIEGTESREQFELLFDYFHSRERFGVVGHRFAAVKDMYLVPLAPHDETPEFIQILEIDEVPEQRDTNIMLAVIVIIKTPSSKRKPQSSLSAAIAKKEKTDSQTVLPISEHNTNYPISHGIDDSKSQRDVNETVNSAAYGSLWTGRPSQNDIPHGIVQSYLNQPSNISQTPPKIVYGYDNMGSIPLPIPTPQQQNAQPVSMPMPQQNAPPISMPNLQQSTQSMPVPPQQSGAPSIALPTPQQQGTIFNNPYPAAPAASASQPPPYQAPPQPYQPPPIFNQYYAPQNAQTVAPHPPTSISPERQLQQALPPSQPGQQPPPSFNQFMPPTRESRPWNQIDQRPWGSDERVSWEEKHRQQMWPDDREPNPWDNRRPTWEREHRRSASPPHPDRYRTFSPTRRGGRPLPSRGNGRRGTLPPRGNRRGGIGRATDREGSDRERWIEREESGRKERKEVIGTSSGGSRGGRARRGYTRRWD
ncbi:8449_t:CDS:2 [Paraglomus brasilianum]|uniref:Transcription factor BYE1 n=1 Tax=Paraglomus brasilianum TaxID=144538 RepID=A0A9N9G3F9_9GLOM|nr:8449_t:CDS:2 [Paraglomus brasilianum]